MDFHGNLIYLYKYKYTHKCMRNFNSCHYNSSNKKSIIWFFFCQFFMVIKQTLKFIVLFYFLTYISKNLVTFKNEKNIVMLSLN